MDTYSKEDSDESIKRATPKEQKFEMEETIYILNSDTDLAAVNIEVPPYDGGSSVSFHNISYIIKPRRMSKILHSLTKKRPTTKVILNNVR